MRDYLAKPPTRTLRPIDARETDKNVIVSIPPLKVFERAILLPTEQ